MDRKDLILILAAISEKPLQPVHLQKALFLIAQNVHPNQLKIRKMYQFEAYDYGPFAKEIYSDAEQLHAEGLLHIDQEPYASYRLYSITNAGRTRASQLIATLDEETVSYLKDVIKWVTSLTFKQLISEIYRLYPSMKVNSVFQE